MGHLVSVVYLYLLFQVSVVDCCTDVLNNCFSGQYDYTDADYLPVGLHLAVLGGNSGNEQMKFCRNYQKLELCVRRHIFSCPEKDSIWKKWTATELLNSSMCSSESRQAIVLYKNCSSEVSTHEAIRECSSYLSWNVSTYNAAVKPELVRERYTEFKERYEVCMKSAISYECPDEVKGWLSKHFEASYFSQLCTKEAAADCSTSKPVIDKQQQCEASYNQKLLTFDMNVICSAIQNYVECAVDAVAKECGLKQAKQAEPSIIAKRQDMKDLFGCTLANIEIDGASGQKEVDCTESKRCARVVNPFCATLPYKEAMFPNSLGHNTLYAAQQAMLEAYPTLYQERCSSLISCFVCSLYFPVCSDLREPVLPCRTLCELVKQSCDGSSDVGIQCESLPSHGFCIGAAQCVSLTPTPVTPSDPPSVTPTLTPTTTTTTTGERVNATATSETSSTTLKDKLKIIIPVCVVAVVLFAIVIVAVIKGLSRNTENIIYRAGIDPQSEEQPIEAMEFSNSFQTECNTYEEIPDTVQVTNAK